ncbi:MAG: RnfABCDGE type electron transport complex subunit B [Bacteroidales bacterium]|nr:RnfABCDGE type electron transport complex subunit B [Bacteroidales bacterium]MCF8343561.1 RnfABCDGE type electron transport complex subunit B [Bacteroidales bacterium]MCF8351405.1 RnfABCDGE type electron transport complex subunit B [Bacteroidales bacterium]MCF8375612.1 RnfABCDGE type electron transport complex subunit B [Bacteroidales bacterium]
MNEVLIIAVISLGAIGVIAAIVLFFVARKFKVIEDPKIDVVEEKLPAANCGGCGFAGCRNFAEAVVSKAKKEGNLEGFNCPVGGNEVMGIIAEALGLEVEESEPQVAVVRCNGSYQHAPKKIKYEGPATCEFAHNLSSGESGCPYGCLGLGDCVRSCQFDAMYMDKETGLPVVIEENCVACGACVKACPRDIIELRNVGKKSRRIFVSCINEEKGGLAKKNCEVACIGCQKCFKVCPFDAITMNNNLAYIDYEKCKLCRKCVPECPTNAIWELNFPPRKEKSDKKPPLKDKEAREAEQKKPTEKASPGKIAKEKLDADKKDNKDIIN